MKLKKFLVAALAVTMIMGSSSMAFAAQETSSGNGGGSGGADLVESSDVFDVVIPTSSEHQFDYILDPTGVIEKTDADKYGKKSFEPGKTVYFQNSNTVTSTEIPYHYSSASNKLEVINKSTGDVDVELKATLTDADEVTMAQATTGLATANDAQLYLALADTGDDGTSARTKVLAKGDAGVTQQRTVTADEAAYEVKYLASEDKYVKTLKTGYDNFTKYDFVLTGECSAGTQVEKAWKAVKKFPKVNIVWTVTGEGEDKSGESSGGATNVAPSIATTAYTMRAGYGIPITVNFGKGDKAATGIEKVVNVTAGGEFDLVAGTDYRVTGTELKIVSAKIDTFISSGKAKTLKVVFNDAAKTTVNVSLALSN